MKKFSGFKKMLTVLLWICIFPVGYYVIFSNGLNYYVSYLFSVYHSESEQRIGDDISNLYFTESDVKSDLTSEDNKTLITTEVFIGHNNLIKEERIVITDAQHRKSVAENYFYCNDVKCKKIVGNKLISLIKYKKFKYSKMVQKKILTE